MGYIQIWHHIFGYQKLLKYFNDFQNRNFSVLWLKWTQTMGLKQNQTFSVGDIQVILKYFKESETKSHKTCANVTALP